MGFKDLAEALKLEHTIFALPFAYVGVWAAARGNPSWAVVAWVTLAMVGVRTAGMAANRLIDLPIDRRNPRTKSWPVPAGRVKVPILAAIAVLAAALFFWVSARLNPLCFRLAPWALALMVFYPLTKRFTWSCHFWLGAVLACAPAAGWLAVTGRWDPRILPLSMGVLFWTAGFDVLYALLDMEFDRTHPIHSVPQQFGSEKALLVSRASHAAAVLSFAGFGFLLGGGAAFWIGCGVLAGLLMYEHSLVAPSRLERINKAFFTVNGWISVSFFLAVWLDLKLK